MSRDLAPRYCRLAHPALEERAGATPLAQARLTDRQKIALLLEAAGLLSLLARAGWSPSTGWQAACVTAEGRLTGFAATPGRAAFGGDAALLGLLAALFGPDPIAGRGEARRSARAFRGTFSGALVNVSPDEAVAALLEAAPFLWEPRFAEARRALVGELFRADGSALPWVAGPAAFRRRLLAEAPEAIRLAEALGGPAARALWDREEEGDPAVLAAAGKWRAAAAAWQRRPPESAEDKLLLARCLWSLGRFEGAVAALAGVRSVPARILAARCQLSLGRLASVLSSLARLAEARLSPDQAAELADIAGRAYANSGRAGRAASYIERALAAADGTAAEAAHLVAATHQWDLGLPAAMAPHLEAARGALLEPQLAWRWHHARGLQALAEGDGTVAVAHVGEAIRSSRRRLPRHVAAGLWNDLGLGRALCGQHAGAERAFLHALHLFGTCDGPRKTNLALFNLAEMRLRRGRLAGVREILERVTLENRQRQNIRGQAQDAALWARFELAQGRAAAALAVCRQAMAAIERAEHPWYRAELAVLAARALGWLGRAAEAPAELEAPAVASELEREEIPALWAHLGRPTQAAAAVGALAAEWQVLWHAALTQQPPEPAAWRALKALEPFRAARLVYDWERLAPGLVPADLLRDAARTLRQTGAVPLAQELETRLGGAWRALADFLASEAELGDLPAIAELIRQAGFPEAELAWTQASQPAAGARPGRASWTAEVDGGWLTLTAPHADPALAALFALAVRGLRLPAARVAEPPRTPRPATGAGRELVGDSPALAAARERIDLLAATEVTILILGESGTGKELAARRLHRGSPRAKGPFLPVNCAALAENLILSELFGHSRGAFTGADRDRAGVFETAQGGTVFLDEIGDLPATAQGMLLRTLQEGEVRRLGESVPRRVDVRVLAATHRDLPRMVEEGTFRGDLYFRLRGGSIRLPPLRERGDDIVRLVESLLAQKGLQAAGVRLSAAAWAALRRHTWPGNVRELENALSLAIALSGGGAIRPEHFDLPPAMPAAESSYNQQVDALRRRLISEALAATGGNRTQAARRLGLTRQALSYLIRQLGLS